MWNTPGNDVTVGVGTADLFGGIEYARYIREDLSIAISVTGVEEILGVATSSEGTFSGTASIGAVQVLARWNPFAKGREQEAVKPFVGAAWQRMSGIEIGAPSSPPFSVR